MKNVKIKLFLLLLLLPVAIYLWPSQIYGNTSYIMLLGNSMSPTIESGTFVIVKSEQDYFLGDIIAFINEDNRNVVHRIIEKTDTGYITKGDNNPRDDPGIVKMEDIVGKNNIYHTICGIHIIIFTNTHRDFYFWHMGFSHVH